MVYCTIHAYTQGNPDKIFRGVAGDKTICGQVDGPAKDYPYLYFYNPIYSTDLRYCVKECPYYDGSTLTQTSIYNSASYTPDGTTYDFKIKQDGSWDTAGNTAPTSAANLYIGYETSPVLDRVCIPSSAAFANALK